MRSREMCHLQCHLQGCLLHGDDIGDDRDHIGDDRDDNNSSA